MTLVMDMEYCENADGEELSCGTGDEDRVVTVARAYCGTGKKMQSFVALVMQME